MATAPTPSDDPLPCPKAKQVGVDLDIPGPGQPTPTLAVAPYSEGEVATISEDSGKATVYEYGDDGKVTRVFYLTESDDGWWPDGYTECAD